MDKLLSLLNQDARFTTKQLADMTGMSEEDVAAKIRQLEKDGVIIGYKTMINWEKTDKESVIAMIEIKTTPQKGMGFDEIAKRISKFSQVENVFLMSGNYDLSVIISGKTMKDIAFFVSEHLAPMEEVLSTSTSFVLKKYKEQGMEFDKKSRDTREVFI